MINKKNLIKQSLLYPEPVENLENKVRVLLSEGEGRNETRSSAFPLRDVIRLSENHGSAARHDDVGSRCEHYQSAVHKPDGESLCENHSSAFPERKLEKSVRVERRLIRKYSYRRALRLLQREAKSTVNINNQNSVNNTESQKHASDDRVSRAMNVVAETSVATSPSAAD